MARRILIVEDNQNLVVNLFGFLEARSYSLDVARDGAAGLELALSESYDAIVLDWMLPRLDGRSVLQRLRNAGVTVPVLMLTARDELEDKIAGFRAGADDYLTKPFALAELEVRLEALIARAGGRKQVLSVADLRFDLATRQVCRNETPLQLYAAIKTLLEVLMRASPAAVPRERLEAALWGENPPDRDLLRSHVYELRRRVDGPFAVKLLHTLPKHGYRIADTTTP
jgi:DNA-binding response OmpR family regulator